MPRTGPACVRTFFALPAWYIGSASYVYMVHACGLFYRACCIDYNRIILENCSRLVEPPLQPIEEDGQREVLDMVIFMAVKFDMDRRSLYAR